MLANPNVPTQIVLPAQPAAGAGLVLTVPALAGLPAVSQAPPEMFWRIEAGGIQLVTSATVANRNPSVVIADQAARQIFTETSTVAVTASSTAQLDIVGADSVSAAFAPPGGAAVIFPVPHIWLPSGYTITISAANLQAGDQISNASFLISVLG